MNFLLYSKKNIFQAGKQAKKNITAYHCVPYFHIILSCWIIFYAFTNIGDVVLCCFFFVWNRQFQVHSLHFLFINIHIMYDNKIFLMSSFIIIQKKNFFLHIICTLRKLSILKVFYYIHCKAIHYTGIIKQIAE